MTDDIPLMNPEALIPLYGGRLPPLRDVRLRSININWRGPTVTLRLDLASFPDPAPAEWRGENVDTVQCQLQFLAVERIVLDGWEPSSVVGIDVIPQDGERKATVRVRGGKVSLEFVSSDSFLVGHVSAFRKQADGSDGGRHLFTRKIDSLRHTTIPSPEEKTFYERL